ncbi:MAG: cysteine desulfurase family protein, partial [Candidatus Hydrothermarchaeales archaeon]
INFDHLACSPVLAEVKEAMLPFFSEDAGNPLSRHLLGDKPRKALEEARQNIANLIGANPEEIIFTSCGSESNNLAVKGIARAYTRKGKHIIASPIEHHSIIHPLKRLEKEGAEISWLKVDEKGNIFPEEVESLIREDTILITVTSASNEIGTLEPIKEIGQIARRKGVVFHTDAVAATGFAPLDITELNVDLLSIAGNVFYGPLGTGALFVKKGTRLFPLIEGGVQEKGLRAGTHNIPAIVGMGVAAKLAREKMAERRQYLLSLRDELIEGMLEKIPDCFLTGQGDNRLPYHASFCIKFIEGESILIGLSLSGIAATSGSTCSSEALKVSHVLDAIGIDPIWAQGSVVFTLGMDNASEDVDILLKELPQTVERLRKMSPLFGAKDMDQFRYREERR